MTPNDNPLRFTDPALYEMRRNGWLKVAQSWKIHTELSAELHATFEPQLLELRALMSYEQLHAVGEVHDLVIQMHHTTGAPLVLPVLFVAAFLERMDDFYRNRTPGVWLTPHPCHVCCYPKLGRYINTQWPDKPVAEGDIRYDPLLPFCPACRTENVLRTFYEHEHTHYPNGRPSYKPGEPLELYRQKNELLAGTWPAEYGVEIPEVGNDVIRKELS